MFPVLITYSNFGYKDFALNLLINLSKKVKNHSIDFYCLDKEIYDFLKFKDFGDLKLNLILFEKEISKGFENYNSSNYIKITHTKLNVLFKALEDHEFIHFIDCDVVCINEPSEEFYNNYISYDIVFQYDCGPSDNLFQPWSCTGNTTFKRGKGSFTMLKRIEQYQNTEAHKNKNDQECLFKFFTDMKWEDIRKDPDCKNFVYPIENYTNGYYIKNNLIDLKNTYFFHANHVIGSEEKIKLLKKVGEWYL
jgi:hypothetical protein